MAIDIRWRGYGPGFTFEGDPHDHTVDVTFVYNSDMGEALADTYSLTIDEIEKLLKEAGLCVKVSVDKGDSQVDSEVEG